MPAGGSARPALGVAAGRWFVDDVRGAKTAVGQILPGLTRCPRLLMTGRFGTRQYLLSDVRLQLQQWAMMSIQPELWAGRAGQAVAFYADAFGARVLHQVGQGDDIVAQLSVGEAAFWVAAADPDSGRFSPDAIGGATGRTLLVADDPDAVVRRAIDSGATEKSALCDEHGWRLGRIVDPFGHEWEIGKPIGPWPPP